MSAVALCGFEAFDQLATMVAVAGRDARFDARMKLAPLGASEALPVRVSVSLTDSGERVLLEMVEIEQQTRQEREERTLGLVQANKELLRNLAHEVKNPLGGIRGAAQLLQMIPEFRGDREQLIQALLNIVRNATEAMAAQIENASARLLLRTRIARQLTIGKQRHRLALELHVQDNGPGVPEALRDRIFHPLVSGREDGTGLGLTLAQSFVQQHQGTIEFDSVAGRTTFKMLIPLP